MGFVFFGAIIGAISALGCTLFGTISLGEAFLIYWIMGTAAPVLHMSTGATLPRVTA